MRRATLLAVLILLSTACAQQPRPVLAPPPGSQLPGVPALQADLAAYFGAPAFGNAVWGVLVRSLKTGETLFAINSGTLLMPASNMKVLTVATAADRLGWDRVFTTKVLATGPIENGVLKGDLVVVGSGDPSLGGRPAADNGVFDAWAAQLRGNGILAIQGRVIGDGRAFGGSGLGAGWTWDDLDAAYSTPSGALTFNENTVQITVRPGAAAGDFAAVESKPGGHGLVIENLARTSAAASEVAISVDRAPGSSVLRVSGTVPAGHAPVARSASVNSPTQLFVGALRQTLSTQGIPVSGDAVDIQALATPPDVTGARTLFVHQSPPLAQIGKVTLKVSQNLYADTLLRQMGCSRPAALCSAQAGIAIVQETLKGWGIAPDRFVMRDGSGLSRYNYLTPEVLVAVLTHMQADSRVSAAFIDALPVAGVDGTIGSRMKDTKAQGNARAKTGSIANARALSGYVTSADGERLVFSMIANNFNVPQSDADHIIDRAVVRLAEFRRH